MQRLVVRCYSCAQAILWHRVSVDSPPFLWMNDFGDPAFAKQKNGYNDAKDDQDDEKTAKSFVLLRLFRDGSPFHFTSSCTRSAPLRRRPAVSVRFVALIRTTVKLLSEAPISDRRCCTKPLHEQLFSMEFQ